MIYLILSKSSVVYAAALSAALWSISRPPALRSDKDTQLYTSWVVHSVSGAVALYVPDDSRPVHPEADIEPLAELIGMAVTDEEKQGFAEYINSQRGGRISFKSVVEASPTLSANLKSREQMEADGWFLVSDF